MRQRAKFAVFVVFAAVFAGAWLVAESMVRQPEAGEASAAAETAAPLDISPGTRGELTALSWSWEGQAVNLRRDEDSGLWENADDPACPIDAAAAEALARAAASATASLAVENVTDMTQYGLSPAGLTVVAATADRIVTYEVGNMSITGEYYIRLNGEDTVYLADGSLAAFRTGLDPLLALETLPEDVSTVTGLTVESEADGYSIACRETEDGQSGWYRTDGETPVRLEPERAQELCQTLFSASLDHCVSWRGEDAALYGVDEPQLTATLSYRNGEGRAGSFSLLFGDYEGSEIYVCLAGSDMIYITSAETADALMYPDWERLTPATVMKLDTEAVASAEVELGGKSYELLRLEEQSERPSLDGENQVTVTDVIYSCNGLVLDTKRVEGWLMSLADMPSETVSPPGEGRQTLLRLTLHWKDVESVPAELELRSYDSSHCLCVLGGDRYMLVARGEAEELVNEAGLLLNGQ